MQLRATWTFTLLIVALLASHSFAQAPEQPSEPLTAYERQELTTGLRELNRSLEALGKSNDAADVAVYAKGLTWALRYNEKYTPDDRRLMYQALTDAHARLQSLAEGKTPWKSQRGKLVAGFVSAVDGSVQPYRLVIPRDLDLTKPVRLDVVLHGSIRPAGMNELRFMSQAETGKEPPADQPFIEAHPLGRVENNYRWAGETDVFEVIADVCRRYNIDRERIVLRGRSMGASGTWHIGLKQPDRFVALGPYCGYVETHRFSKLPIPHFVPVDRLPEYQEQGLHMLDAVDYAANAGTVPVVACMGELDPFFSAHEIMREAMQREGLTLVNLIAPKAGHANHPPTFAEQMRRIGEHAARGVDRHPSELRFVTWTLRFNRCHWLEVQGLKKHYARAEFAAKLNGDVLVVSKAENITRFAIDVTQFPKQPASVRIGTQELSLPQASPPSRRMVFARRDSQWDIIDDKQPSAETGKRPGLQGPIDDAFTAPFLCVRGTGQAWNPVAQQYADAALARFADDWGRYLRGDLPVKDDTAVTEEDLKSYNLILFGDPGSNPWIAKALPQLPIEWSREAVKLNGQSYAADSHVPALIAPNPLDKTGGHYVVLNSGHTFHTYELKTINYLLYPHWGDWAVLKPVGSPPEPGVLEEVITAGYFDEQWRVPGKQGVLSPSPLWGEGRGEG